MPWHMQRPVAVRHLGVLQMIAGARKQVVVADVVVMQMADDDVLDLVGVDADRLEPLADRLEQGAAALLGHGGVEAGVDDEGAGGPDDRPDVIVERLQDVVRIAADVVLRRAPVVMAVADGIDFVDVVAHDCSLPCAIMHNARSIAMITSRSLPVGWVELLRDPTLPCRIVLGLARERSTQPTNVLVGRSP